MKKVLRANLVGGAHGLVEAVLEENVKARRAILGTGGGARKTRLLGRRRSSMFTANGAYAYSQSQRRRLSNVRIVSWARKMSVPIMAKNTSPYSTINE